MQKSQSQFFLLQKQHLTFLEFTVFYCHGLTFFHRKIYRHFLQCRAFCLYYSKCKLDRKWWTEWGLHAAKGRCGLAVCNIEHTPLI